MRKKLKSALILASLFVIIVPNPTIRTPYSFPHTYELPAPGDTGIAFLKLKVGDLVEGSVSVSHLGPYELLYSVGTTYGFVDVWFEDPNKKSILEFRATPSENSFNFSFIAHEQGLFMMWTSVGAMDYHKDPHENPRLTLDYDIVRAPTPTSVTQPFPTAYSIGISAIVCAVIILSIVILGLKRKKGNGDSLSSRLEIP